MDLVHRTAATVGQSCDRSIDQSIGSMDEQLTASAADVTYNTSSFPALLSTLLSLLNPPSSAAPPDAQVDHAASHPENELPQTRTENDPPLLLLAYKERDPAERDLWDMLRKGGVEMVLVDQVRGAEERGETEIWVGRFVGARDVA